MGDGWVGAWVGWWVGEYYIQVARMPKLIHKCLGALFSKSMVYAYVYAMLALAFSRMTKLEWGQPTL